MADYLVFEGRADSFARLIEPGGQAAPWTSALTPRQESEAWRIIGRHLQATDPQLLQGLMYGGAEGVRRWAGYTVGFHIVQAFLQSHPDLNVREWTAIPADELVRQSGYDPGH